MRTWNWNRTNWVIDIIIFFVITIDGHYIYFGNHMLIPLPWIVRGWASDPTDLSQTPFITPKCCPNLPPSSDWIKWFPTGRITDHGDLKYNIVHWRSVRWDAWWPSAVLSSGIWYIRFSKVVLCVHRDTKAKYAVKCLDLGLVETEEGLQGKCQRGCQKVHSEIVGDGSYPSAHCEDLSDRQVVEGTMGE